MRRLAVLIVCALVLPVSVARAWTWPVDGPVLRPFSFDRAHPYAAGQHRGIDLGAPTGRPVLAPAEGVVSFAGTVPGGGKTISIQTPFGYTATLVHLGSIGVTRGALVGQASVVGTVGPSGEVDLAEPFVYFGVRVTNDPQGYVDPLTLLPPRAVPVQPSVSESPAPAASGSEATSGASEVATAGTGSPVATAEPASTQAPPAVQAQPDAKPVAAAPEAAAVRAAPAAASSVASRQVAPEPVVPRLSSELVSIVMPRLGQSSKSRPELSDDVEAHAPRGAAGSDGLRSLGPTAAASGPFVQAYGEAHAGRGSAVASSARARASDHLRFVLALAALTLAAGLALVLRRRGACKAARIMSLPEPEHVVGEAAAKEDSGRARMAVRSREASSGPRGRIRRAGGRLRALPAPERERRADGEWDGRAWDAGDGHGGSRRRLAA